MHTATDAGPASPFPDISWVARLLQASDSAYPTGSYAHSWGLEGLCQEGVVRDRATLGMFLERQVFPQLARTELPVAAAAWRASRQETPDWERLRVLCGLGSALRGSREPRQASEAVGHQRVELAALLHGGLAKDFREKAAAGGWPVPSCVAAGVEGASIGAPVEAVLSALFYSTITGLIAAAVKLLRLGQNAVQTLLSALLAQAPQVLAEALALPLEQCGSFNPWWDIASSRHENADFRLFIS